jgi:hypothetical protein
LPTRFANGFFSIVQKGGAHHVRARVRQDLEQLVSAAGLEGIEIQEWPEADYRWRILVQPPQVATIFQALAGTIDYSNFKSRIHARPDQADKARAYGRLWGDLLGLQQ